jgi:molybdenum cofactor cytidylyltransferase
VAPALAVVLAAGGASRFAGPDHKLLAEFRGRPLASWAVDSAVASGLPTLVVHGAVDLSGLARELGAEAVANPRWAEGQATSLQVALAAAAAGGHPAVVVGLADQPLLSPQAWMAVADRDDAPVAVATYGGERRHPVRLGAEVWPLLPGEGDEGAGRLLASGAVEVAEVACPGMPVDVDTREDLRRWV